MSSTKKQSVQHAQFVKTQKKELLTHLRWLVACQLTTALLGNRHTQKVELWLRRRLNRLYCHLCSENPWNVLSLNLQQSMDFQSEASRSQSSFANVSLREVIACRNVKPKSWVFCTSSTIK